MAGYNEGVSGKMNDAAAIAGKDELRGAQRALDGEISAFVKEKANAGRRLGGLLPVLTGGIDGKPAAVMHGNQSVKWYKKSWKTLAGFDHQAFKKAGGKVAVLAPSGRFDIASQMTLACPGMPWDKAKRRVVSINRPMSKITLELNELLPSALAGYPSVLIQLAKEALEGRLKIAPVAVICWGEMLGMGDESAIAGAFGCKVLDVYLSAEGAFAVKCGHGYFHAQANCKLEVADDGELLLSCSPNPELRLVRYGTGDIGERVEACPCGKGDGFLLKGRRSDFPVIGGKRVETQPLIDAMERLSCDGIERYQIRQADDNTLAIYISCEQERRVELFRRCMAAVEKTLAEAGITGVRIALGGDPPAAHKRSGKFRKVTGLDQSP